MRSIRLACTFAAVLVLAGAPAVAHHRPGHGTTTTTSATTTTVAPTTTTVAPTTTTTTTLPPTTTTVAPTTTTPPPNPAAPTLGHFRNLDGTSGDPNGSSSRSDFTELTEAAAQWGPFEGHARQFYAPGSVPLNSAADQLLTAGWDLFLNWKPFSTSPAQTCAGGYTTQIDQAAADIKAKAPSVVWVTLYHEPDGDGVNQGDYRCMWRVVQDRFQAAGVTNVTWVWTITGYDIPGRTASGELPGLWPGDPATGTVVDLAGIDPYIDAGDPPAELPARMLERTQQLKTLVAGFPGGGDLPVVFPEWGTDLGGTRGSTQHRADAYAAVQAALPDLTALGVVELDLFDAREHHIRVPSSYPAGSPLLDSAADEQAYGALKAATG